MQCKRLQAPIIGHKAVCLVLIVYGSRRLSPPGGKSPWAEITGVLRGHSAGSLLPSADGAFLPGDLWALMLCLRGLAQSPSKSQERRADQSGVRLNFPSQEKHIPVTVPSKAMRLAKDIAEWLTAVPTGAELQPAAVPGLGISSLSGGCPHEGKDCAGSSCAGESGLGAGTPRGGRSGGNGAQGKFLGTRKPGVGDLGGKPQPGCCAKGRPVGTLSRGTRRVKGGTKSVMWKVSYFCCLLFIFSFFF